MFWFRLRYLAHRFRRWLTLAAAYLALVSVFQFANFILEEAIQTTIFGTWQAKNNPRLTRVGIKLIEALNWQLNMVNNTGGWLNPVGWYAYRAYGKATDYYIMAAKNHILALDPQCMEGECLEILFQPDRSEHDAQETRLTNGKITLILPAGSEIPREPINVTVARENGAIVLRPAERSTP